MSCSGISELCARQSQICCVYYLTHLINTIYIVCSSIHK